jgi:hypothetical protein
MEMKVISFVTAILFVCLFSGCQKFKRSNQGEATLSGTPEFKNYWHAGKAEINTFNLQQSRYGELRPGKAVLIFVTEDFSKKFQVKTENASWRNKINVMKLNYTKNFITGIYPYSMMLSVFTPVNRSVNSSSLKATMSAQEWCGQVYTQMNLRGNRYAVKSHSYFEHEADERFSIREALLEDELWNFIRLDHTRLPIGTIDVIPGLFFTRLNHVGLKVTKAITEKSETDSAFIYQMKFPEQERLLTIMYDKKFPFKILGWRESWNEKGKVMETTAELDKTIYTDYWTKNKNEFQHLRDSLGLPFRYESR